MGKGQGKGKGKGTCKVVVGWEGKQRHRACKARGQKAAAKARHGSNR